MSEQENTPNEPKKKFSFKTLNKKKLTKFLITIGVIGGCAFGINSYISYKHQVFLEGHTTAIADIQNKNEAGYSQAFSILKELVDDNKASTEDYFYLGYMYHYGLGTSKDYSDAYKYYKKAATDNYPQAFYQLAILYRDGSGVNKSNKNAIEYFEKAFELGDEQAIVSLAELVGPNNQLLSIISSEFLYDIYLAYKDNKIVSTDQSIKDKYLSMAAAQGYEPAIIVQARNFTKSGDNYRALMLWQTLLYSSDPKVSQLAKKEILEVEKLVKEERLAEQERQKQLQLEEQKKEQQKLIAMVEREKHVEYKKEVGLSIPKQKLKNLNGLIYLNLFNINKIQLQQFYYDIMGVKLDTDYINNSNNIDNSYIDDFLTIAKLKHNRSSMKFDFGNKTNNNRYEGIVYYFYNNENKAVQDLLSHIIKSNNPKASSLIPKLNDTLSENKVIKEKQKDTATIEDTKKQPKEQIVLTHEEQIQRMQVFAQKGDFREFYKLEQAAKAGDVYAMYYVGEYYYNNKEYDEALKYYKEAADKNYGPAYYKLASLYYNEERNGVPYDKQKAMEYYKKAADLGVRNAKHILMLIE